MGSVPARYALVELADLLPSHDFSTGAPRANENYPRGLQPRDYKPASAEAEKVRTNEQEARPGYFISEHPAADNGPPTVTRNGRVVLNGNGRVMTLQLAA